MQITGKLISVLPNTSGEGKQGPWTKGGIIIETEDAKYPKKIAFTTWNDMVDTCESIAWNDMVDTCESIAIGTAVRISFDLESREYQNKWYTDAKASKIEVNKNGNYVVPEGLHKPNVAPVVESNPQDDDLPF